MMSPRPAPRDPTLPWARKVMYWPVATPGGIRTVTDRSTRTRPSPRHFLHGDETTAPSPAHVGHAATRTNCRTKERCARRASPAPAHVGHLWGLVPGSAPEPPRTSHVSSNLTAN